MSTVRDADEPDASSMVDFEAFYNAHAERLRRVVTRRVRDAHLAEDVVQETFLRAHRFIDRLDQERPAWPWLRTIAMRLAFNATRHQRFDREDLVAEPIELPDVDGAAVQGERRLLQARLVRVLASLPHRQQRLLVLHDMFGVGCDELASTEGATATALRKATSRARRALRDDAQIARLGVFAPVAAMGRALRRARARVYGWSLTHGGPRRGGMSHVGGEALAPMAMMVCALVPSMMLPPAHPDGGVPPRAVAGGARVASSAAMPQPSQVMLATAGEPLALAKPAPTRSSDGVPTADDSDRGGAVVGPADVAAGAPVVAELDAGERRADGAAPSEGDAPDASKPPSTPPTAPASHTRAGPTNGGVGGSGNLEGAPDGPRSEQANAPTVAGDAIATEVVSPTPAGPIEAETVAGADPVDVLHGVRL